MDINVSAGTTIWLNGSSPLTKDLASFEALSFTQVKGVRAVSDLGDTATTFLNRPIVGKPSNVKAGSKEETVLFELYKAMTNEGQQMLKTLAKSSFEYSFKVVQPDNEVFYFTATASERKVGVGNGSAIVDSRINLELTCNIVTN